MSVLPNSSVYCYSKTVARVKQCKSRNREEEDSYKETLGLAAKQTAFWLQETWPLREDIEHSAIDGSVLQNEGTVISMIHHSIKKNVFILSKGCVLLFSSSTF